MMLNCYPKYWGLAVEHFFLVGEYFSLQRERTLHTTAAVVVCPLVVPDYPTRWLPLPGPDLSVYPCACLHGQLLTVHAGLHALLCVGMVNGVVLSVLPLLVSFLAVARINNDALSSRIIQASIVSTDFSVLTQHPILVAPLVVTRPHVDRFVVVVVIHRTVDTHRLGLAADLSRSNGFPWNKQVWVDIFDEPVKAMALQTFPELLSVGDISVISQIIVESFIIIVLVFVHPNFGQSDWVFLDNIDTSPPLVRTSLSEDVTNMRAWNDF